MSKRREQYEEDFGEWDAMLHHRNRAYKGLGRKARNENSIADYQRKEKRRQKIGRYKWQDDE